MLVAGWLRSEFLCFDSTKQITKSRDFPRQISNSNRDPASKEMSTVYTPFCTEANCPASRGVSGGCFGQCQACKVPFITPTDTQSFDLDGWMPHLQHCIMSTGAGKSLCMFLPPLAMSSSCMGVVPDDACNKSNGNECANLVSYCIFYNNHCRKATYLYRE